MCIKRRIEEAQFGSTIEYQGRKWVILSTELEDEIEKVGLQLREGSNMLSLPYGTEIVSHSLTPIERRRLGTSRCELPLVEVEKPYFCYVQGCLEAVPHTHQGDRIVPVVLPRF